MKSGYMTWSAPDELLPPVDEDNVDTSAPVVVTFDGKHIAAVAVYDHGVQRWYEASNGKRYLIDTPLLWSCADIKFDKITV